MSTAGPPERPPSWADQPKPGCRGTPGPALSVLSLPIGPPKPGCHLLHVVPRDQPHLAESAADFTNWFQGPNNSLVRQVAKKKRAAGGPLDQAVVQRVLSDQGWRANREAVAVMHRLLEYYAAMAPERRSADRLAKSRKARSPREGPIGVDVALPVSCQNGSPAHAVPEAAMPERRDELRDVENRDELANLAKQFCSARGISCKCVKPVWVLRCDAPEEADAVAILCCRGCSSPPLQVPLNDLRQIAASLR